MKTYRFLELVEKEKGFEFYQAFRDEVDWIIGGKGDTYWFAVMQDQSVKETYIGTLKDGAWADCKVKGKGKRKTVKEMPAGSTIKRIEERAYFMQDAEWVKGELTSCRMRSGLREESQDLLQMRTPIITMFTALAIKLWTYRRHTE